MPAAILALMLAGVVLPVGAAESARPASGTMTAMETVSTDRLRHHVEVLAGEIGERNVWRPQALARAADYIRDVWNRQGYRVHIQEYDVQGVTSANLEIAIPGGDLASQILLLGAHYDSVQGSPGANDNGTGVAALLELSRCLADRRPRRTIRFVAFTNEEPPLFWTRDMGSEVYVRAARERGDDIRAMISLETLGYYSDAPGSQRYPLFLGWFYPDRADFIGFVSNVSSRALLGQTVAAFRAASDFPEEHIAAPAWVPGVGWSDQLSFWLAGYRAVMVTDTALYRYPWYHTAQDTPDKLDYTRLTRITHGLCGAIAALADMEGLGE